MDSSNFRIWAGKAATAGLTGCKVAGRLTVRGCRVGGRLTMQGYRRAKPEVVRFYRWAKPATQRQWERLQANPSFQKHKRPIYLGSGGVGLVLLLLMFWPGGGRHRGESNVTFVNIEGNTTANVQVSVIGDVSGLPPVVEQGRPPVAAGRFEPSGAKFPEGLRVKWSLKDRREPGSALWIVTMDEAKKRWVGTGQMAQVAASGKEASGLVYHFTDIGLSDQKPAVEEGSEGDHGGNKGGSRKWGAFAQLANYVEVKHGGSAEAAMVEYNKWLAGGGQALVGGLKSRIEQNRAQQEQYRKAVEAWEKIPESQRPAKDFKEPKTVFESMTPAEQESIHKLMLGMYGAAGQGKEAFHTVALVIDKGLQAPSEDFKKNKYSAEAVNNELSLVMAEARDHWIDEVIIDVAQKNGWKVRRSDSGNQTSGMKSDLDQTFYVFDSDGKRLFDKDKEFIEQFKAEWENRNKARNEGKLGLESLDIASIEGRNRFPDPRAVKLTSYSQEFRRTVIALRNTPGAYTTYGAVLQQMQLRALEAIRQKNPRRFAGMVSRRRGARWGSWRVIRRRKR